MPTQCSLTSNLALLMLLGTVTAGPFSPRSNVTLPAPRPPPQPGGRTVQPEGGGPSSRLYEHTVEGGEKQVVFTHRINLPPSAGCGCPPGTEPPVPASEVQALRVRLEILEELVKGLKEQCTGGCCPPAAQAGTGQTDIRSLCSLHGVFDLSRCACSCEPGWGGPTCSDPAGAEGPPSSPPSAPGSCPDDCNDQGRCVRGRCVCFPGYTGPSCSWPSCPGDCHGRGRCVQGVCVCRSGFSGDDCSVRSCPRGCSQRGRCEDGRCVCNPGYSGEDCGVRSCPRDCSQRGRCENGRCVCNPGYTGDDCGVRSCPRGCSQKGRCEDGRCVCDPGYAGDDCGSRTCPWDCGEGGRCVDGRCVCWPGYAGEDCSTRTCPRDCRGRGRCEDGECICDPGYSGDDCGVRSCPGDCNQRGRCEDGRCVCWPGYSGPDCGARACPRDCRGRGRCENGVCVCHAGYSGEDCGVRSCPGDCRGRGRCESGRCVCWPGYTGRDCGTRACPGDCRGRGRCVDGRCVCNPGFAGDDCGSRRCPGDCRGRGRCEDGVCSCDLGYEGEDCGTRSCPRGCQGRGQCLEGRCVCDDGYEGEDCGVRRCPRDCNQRGVCQDGVCTCWEGFAGEDCGLRVCPSNCHRRGRCENGRCVCDSGYTGPSCATRTCPADCRGRGRCVQGVCVCHVGYSGEDCGQEEPPASACPGGCGPRELCRAGQCVCVEGFRGPDCAIQTCPGDCRGRGECHEGSCVCQDGYAGEDCGEEVPAIEGMRMHLLEETTVRTEWTRAPGNVDAYEIQFIPTTEGASPPFTARVPSSSSAYDQRGLAPGQEYQVTVRALRGTSWGPPASKTITTMIDGPQDLRVVAVTPTTLELNWLRPQAEVDRFVVSYVSAGNQRVRLEVPSEADRTLLTGLMPGVEYVVTVTAERGRAVSYPASIRANTGSSLSGLMGATDEPPPSGPSTTQGAQAPVLQQRPQELAELRVLGKDKTGRLRVAWTAQPDTFTHFQLRLRVPEGPGAHEELLPGDVRQALVPSPPPESPYELSLRGIPPDGEPSAPLIYQGIMDKDGEKPGKPLAPPRLGKLTVTDVTSDSLLLHWTVPEGEFDSFVIQYKDRDRPQVVPVEGPQRSALISNLDVGRKYKFVLYGLVGKKRHGPLVAEAKILSQTDPNPVTPPRLGKLWVTDPTPDSLHLSWTVPEGQFDSFVVQYRDRDGRPQVVPVEGPERSIIISPLDPDHKYRFTLFGIANKKRHGPLTADGTTAPEKKEESRHPEPPERPLLGELTVAGATADSLRLSWTVAQGSFDSFVVQYKDAQGRPQAVPVRGDENEVAIPGLEPDRKYKMNLYGLHGRQRMGPVSVVATTAPQEVLDETPSATEMEETPSPTEPSTEAPEPPKKPLLGELMVTGSSPDSLSLSWTVPQGHFDSFTVQYRDGDGQPRVVRVPGNEDGVTISGLEPDHKYKMNLYGFHDRQRVGPVSVIGVTTTEEETPSPTEMEETPSPTEVEETPSPTEPSTEAPEPPEEPLLGELTVTGSSPDSLSLSWTVPQGYFDSFTIQYKGGDGPQVVRVGGEETEVTVGGLEPGRKYKMNLYGLHGGRRVGPASTVGVTAPEEEPPASPPLKPQLGELTVTDATPDSLSLSWTIPEGQFDHFLVQYKNGDGQPKAVRVPGDEDGVTISGLEPDHKYKMNLYGFHDRQRVGPVSTVGLTASEKDQEMTPAPTDLPTVAPEPPIKPRLGEVTVTDATPDSLSLSWTVPEGQFDHFLIQYKNGDGQPKAVRVPGDEDGVTISGLEPDYKYKMNLYGFHDRQRVGPISVIGVTTAEEETPSPTEVEETPSPTEPSTEAPEPPEEPLLGELTVTGSSPDSLSLSWTIPQGHFDSFTVQYKGRDGPQVVRVGGEETEVTVGGLEPGRKYKMNLYGLHGGRRMGPASTVGMTDPREVVEETPSPTEPSTEAPEPPEEPLLGELTVTGSSPDSLSLSWTVPQGHFDSFTVQFKGRDGPQVVRVGGEQTEVTVGGLEPGRKYKMNLYGLHGGQRMGPMSTVGVTAPDYDAVTTQTPSTAVPEPPTKPRLGEVTVTDATPDSLSLSWTVPEGQFDHFLIQYKNGDGQPKAVRVPGDEDGVTISGLEPDHKYKMNLYGFHDRQRVGPVSVIGVTTTEEETPSPTEMEETPSPTEMEETPSPTEVEETPSSTEMEETPSPTEPSTEAPEPPEEPLLGELTVTGSSPDSLSLSWTIPQGHFDSFTVQYKGRDGPQVVRVGGEETEVTVGGLEPGRKYKMNLYGLHGGRRVGPASTVGVTASLTTERPLAPRLGELAVAAVTSDTARLSWTVEQGPFDAFLVQYKDVQGQPQAVPVAGDLREVTVSSLAPGRKYKFLLFGLRDEKRHGPVSADAKTLPDTKPAPHLGELTVTDVTPDSVGLSWTVPEGEFDSFVVQYKDRDGQPRVVPVAADQRKVTIPGLEPSRKYKFLLYGLVGRKRLGPISAEGSTAPLEKERQPPPRLGELTVMDETPNSLRLSWTVARGPFDSFVVQYRGTDGQPRMVPVAADQREFTVEGLEPGRKYKFLLYGLLLGGQRLGPASVLGTTAPEEDTPAPWRAATEAPKPPEGPRLGVLAVRDVSPDSLRLSWSVVQGPFDSFVVQYQDTDGQPQALLVGGDQNKVLVSGLEPSTSYEFFLYGLHEGKRLGPVSAEGTTGPVPAGQTPGEPGPRLSHLSVTDVTTSSLRLNWEAPPEAFDSFLLRFGVPSPSTLEPQLRPLLQRELTVPGTRRSAMLRDLHPGTLYTLTLYGLRGPHKADSIQGTARTLSPVLESPRDLQFSEIRETSARVSWTPPTSRVDGFKVSYQLADGGEPQSVQVDGRTQKLEGLIPGAQYEVTVVSVRGFEESEPLTGFLTTVPDGPTQLRALNLTDESALLHWKPPQTPVDTYDVKVTALGAPSLQASAPGSAVDYPLQGLVTHTNYTATLRGLRGPNFTSPASITFTTGLEAPQDLEAKEVTPRTALLTWTAPEVSPTGYLLSFNTPGGQTQEIVLPGGVTSHQLRGLFPSTPYSTWLRAMWGDSFTPPVTTSFTTGGLRIPFPRDCGEEMQNGVSTSRTSTIFLNGNREQPLNVFCDMETDGGGWLVFQRRMDGKTDFWRDWEDYAHGFGNISGEFWLGNEALHSLTRAGDYSLRVDLRAGDEAVFAQYDSFQVDSAEEYYRLHLEGYHGTAGDSMSYHSGSVFSARDRDPNNLLISCAVSYRGAWWYRNCHYANLNGLYGSTVDHQGVSWYYWKGFDFSVPFTEMKLRPRNYRPPGRGG
ncbi:PREDICTED: tenascin-X isoform X6 [Capra hircus]|uniref:tenascin-X isoform X6 n=1 Tax=Capra hircus TaxID=9925 RepID=UPI0008465C38|nr:PREDICTED: tenascin-X isoform X6 [Capra hircus]